MTVVEVLLPVPEEVFDDDADFELDFELVDFLTVVAVVSGAISTNGSVVVVTVGAVTATAFVVEVAAVTTAIGSVVDVTAPIGWMLAVVLVASSETRVVVVAPSTVAAVTPRGAVVATTCPRMVVVDGDAVGAATTTEGGHGNS